jgi:hypothetical protein
LTFFSTANCNAGDEITVNTTDGRVTCRFSGPKSEFIPIEHTSDRFWYLFTSDEARSAWGFRATVSVNYPKLAKELDPMVVLNELINSDMFHLLLGAATGSGDDKHLAGMTLSNVLGTLSSRNLAIGRHGQDWVKSLLSCDSVDVQTCTILNLFDTDMESGQVAVTSEIVNMVKKQGLISQFVGLLLSQASELRDIALRVLHHTLNLSQPSIEAVLLECVYNEEVRKQALEELSRAVQDTDKRSGILELGAVVKLKPLLDLPSTEIVIQAGNALVQLLQTEGAVDQFLNSDGGSGKDILEKLLSHSDAEVTALGLRLLSTALQKKPADDSHLLRENESHTYFSQFVQICGSSVCITPGIRPYYADTEAPEALDGGKSKRRKSKKTLQISGPNTTQFALSFWALLDGVPDGDGVSVFTKTSPNYELVNRNPSRITVRAECALKRGRTYFEITLQTTGTVTVSRFR